MKLIRSIAFGLCLALTASFTVALASTPDVPESPIASSELPTSVRLWGSVTKTDEKNSRIEVADGTNPESKTVLLINDDTDIVDNQSKEALSIQDIKKGDTIYAWHSPVMTMSLPPQTNTQVIVTNIAADQMAGQLFEVIEAAQNKSNLWTLLNQERDLYATIPSTMKSIPVFHSSKTLKPSEITSGTRLLIWYDATTRSFPAQTTIRDALVLSNEYNGYISVDDTTITADGKVITRHAYIDSNGEYYVPLTDIARIWGFSARWNNKNNTMTIQKNKTRAVFTKDKKEFSVHDINVSTLAPIVKNKTLYVSVDSLHHLGKYKIVLPMEND